MNHPCVVHLIATTAACVCGFCIPTGRAKYFFFFFMNQAAFSLLELFLEVLVHHFLKSWLLSFSLFCDVSALLQTLHVIRACNVREVLCGQQPPWIGWKDSLLQSLSILVDSGYWIVDKRFTWKQDVRSLSSSRASVGSQRPLQGQMLKFSSCLLPFTSTHWMICTSLTGSHMIYSLSKCPDHSSLKLMLVLK